MFYLHASNRTENLLLHLAKLIESARLPAIFDREYIIIQSQGMERMVSQAMASSFTSWCNYRYLLPVNFLHDIAARLALEISPDCYERSYLVWRIEEKLRRIEDPVYQPLQQYLQGARVDLKRYQLARQLANVFDQYQLMRPHMLKSWENGKTCAVDSAEIWQMHLWNRLTGDHEGVYHRGELLERVTQALYEMGSCHHLPKRISVFGVHTLPPFFLDYLSGLAKHSDVHLFLLSPCRQYWADMNRRDPLFNTIKENVQHHPLLASLGKQGRDFQELLLEKVTIEKEFLSYEDPAKKEPPFLLHMVQQDLLDGTLADWGAVSKGDDSIRIISCHSQLRELEVLKDHILHLLDCNQELELRDIVVMAPDIQQYASLVAAVFDEMQHSIADRSLVHRNGYIAAFRQFLDLFYGDFGWAEVLDLLQKEQIYPNFALRFADFELLQHWIVNSGIRWGLSAESRRTKGVHFSENSWQSGLERLLMGYAIDTDEQVAGVYPYGDVEGNGAIPLGGLCRYIEIIAKADHQFKMEFELAKWSDVLLEYAELLFGNQQDREFLELKKNILELHNYGQFHKGKLSVEVIIGWLEHSLTESRSTSGFLKGNLTFCSLLPMRSIPFKAICLVGMNYGVFPASDHHATFDLMKKQPVIGDRSLRADDRYQFLEVLLAARQSLYISYIGQSQKNNDIIPPSVVVAELLEVLKTYSPKRVFIEHHPLYGFSKRYFSKESELFSYNEKDYRVALTRCAPLEKGHKWWSGLSGFVVIDSQEINLSDLFRFYSHPQRYFLQHNLGVYPGSEISEPEESETFISAGLQAYQVNQLLLHNQMENGDCQRLFNRLRLDGMWPLAVPGEIFFKQRREEIEHFAMQVKALDIGEAQVDSMVDLHGEDYRLRGRLANRYTRGYLLMRYGDLRGSDLVNGWLHHLLRGESEDFQKVTYIMMKDRLVVFQGDDCPGPSLAVLIEMYRKGISSPSKLLLEPGLEYCRQKNSPRAKLSPLQKARNTYRGKIDSGFEPAWSLLYGNQNDEEVVDGEFVECVEDLLMPLWSMAQ